MPDFAARRRPARWLAIAVLVAAAALPIPAWATEQKQVLVLYATRRDAQVAVLGDRELPRILEHGLGASLDYYAEYLDLGRFPDEGYQNAVREFLQKKYKEQRFDLVVAMHDIALQFVAAHRQELFPGVPIVFASTAANTRRLPNSTGIIAPYDFGSTLALAAVLQPEIRRVVVVTGADRRDVEFERQARSQFRPFEQRFAFTYLGGLPTRELEHRLATLPADAVVYYLLVNRDGSGESFHPLEYLDRITAVTNVPVYCWVDSAMGRGIVGGSLKSQSKQVEILGGLALRVLRGDAADSIPTISPDLNVTGIDWRQLERWRIDAARVPKGTLVLFREPSAWDRYKVYIVGAVAVLLAQSALIAALLVQRRRRRTAEAQVRGSQYELRQSYERIHDLAGRLLNAQDSERARIARELHDDISQEMALLSIDLEILKGLAEGDTEEVAGEALRRAQTVARSVHDLSHRLHPAKLRLIGLVPALQALQREMERAGIPVTFRHDAVPPALSTELSLCVYRIVQEALQNALKHSRAREVAVHLRGTPDSLDLTVADDGVGFQPAAAWSSGLGLISMRERVDAIGGTLEIHTSLGRGTRLHIKVPLSTADAAVSAATALHSSDPASQSRAESA